MAKAKSSNAVGIIGLGSMGLGVAHTLLGKGFTVYAYDVRPQVLRDFARKGGKACASPAEVGAKAPVVIVLVVSADQTAEVLVRPQWRGCAHGARLGGDRERHGGPGRCRSRSARASRRMGIHMIDAPVSGGAARAASGQLSIMASGAREAFTRAEAALGAIAAKVYRLGDTPGMGSKVKMINQLLAGVHIAASAEAMALGIRAGVDPNVLYEVICNSAGSSWMFQNRVPHILAGDYTPLSAVNIFIKDLGIVVDSARQNTFPVPLTSTAHQLFIMAGAHGHGMEDDSAVVKVFQALSGIPLPEKRRAPRARPAAKRAAAARKPRKKAAKRRR